MPSIENLLDYYCLCEIVHLLQSYSYIFKILKIPCFLVCYTGNVLEVGFIKFGFTSIGTSITLIKNNWNLHISIYAKLLTILMACCYFCMVERQLQYNWHAFYTMIKWWCCNYCMIFYARKAQCLRDFMWIYIHILGGARVYELQVMPLYNVFQLFCASMTS